MASIVCHDLTKTYYRGSESVTPLESLDLEISDGQFVALMGPSGSGKTTLLNLIAGIDRPTSGTLMIGSDPIHDMSRSQLTRWRSRGIGYIFQLYNLIPVLTALENVELPLLLHPMSRAERLKRARTALELVGIADRAGHYPRQLSGGQEQRVAIARAIVTDPAVVLADEPTGDLDGESAQQIMELLSSLHRDLGKTIVMVTHDPKTAHFADRELHLQKGRLVEDRISSESISSTAGKEDA